MIIFLIYLAVLAVMSIITFFLYFSDKRRAVREEWRIREVVLLFFGFFGGAFGALCGMVACRHKIRRWYFWAVNIISLILHIAAGVIILLFALGYYLF